jgi:alkylhydroperoxidase/carboxymuconolactone decarboxylase family protein YurZ
MLSGAGSWAIRYFPNFFFSHLGDRSIRTNSRQDLPLFDRAILSRPPIRISDYNGASYPVWERVASRLIPSFTFYGNPNMAYDGTLVLEYLARTHKTALITDREKHLIGLAVTMTRGCQVCTRGRIEKARAVGLDDTLLNALVDLVSSINAGVAAATAREAFRMADAASAEACNALCSPEVSAGR